jgi:hypothetical protein
MRRLNILALALVLCCVPEIWAQIITGSGTTNTIPQFTSATTIGDSPILQSNGNVGIGPSNPQAKLDVFDPNGNSSAPYAILGQSECPLDNFCGAIRGNANNFGIGVIGISGNQQSVGGGGVIGITFGTSGFSYGARGDALGTTGSGVGLFAQAFSRDGSAAHLINRAAGTILLGQVGPEGSEKSVFRVDGKGTVHANGGFRPFGADFAESMPVKGDRSRYEPGDLLVIDRTSNRRLALANDAYSTLVAGIYSTNPGVRR